MATASFHRFTLLPPEIQQQIWMIAGESTSGAHFFTYSNPGQKFRITRRNRFIRRTTLSGPYLLLGVPADDHSVIRTAEQKHKDDFVLGTYEDNGVTRNVIVRSDTDLVILRPTHLSKLNCNRAKMECPPDLKHFALEYNPSWSQFGQDLPPLKRLAWLAADICCRQRLVGFIDYSLRRRPDAGGYLDE